MATAPQINYFDKSGTTTQLVVTTNLYNLILTGTVDANTVDVQVNINNAGFVSDPTLVGLAVPDFTIPNLASFPNGLPLERGSNTISIRAIDLSGAVSPVSTATVTVVTDTDLQLVQAPPTGIQLGRFATSIELSWADTGSDATGFNVYASTGSGGTNSGYLRVNSDLIPASSPVQTSIEEFPVQSWSYDFQDSPNDDFQVISRTVDSDSGTVIDQKSLNQVSLLQNPNYRYAVTVSALATVKQYKFSHDRDASLGSGILNNDVFSSVLSDEPLYYVITAVYYDKLSGVLQESRYSPELSGAPLPLNTLIRGIKIRDQRLITQDYIGEIQKKEQTLSLIPGSTVREVHIEPFSNEAQKVYFLADFVHRAKSFPALLAIDDPGLTGTSVPVSQSQYKQSLRTALSINDDSAVQSLIDNAFDSLAANCSIPRQGPRAAQVLQTFYTTVKPVRDLIILQGAVITSSNSSSAPRFITKSQATIPASSAQSFYNPATRRYEIRVQAVADTPGTIGNVPAETLDSVVSGAVGLQTVNEVTADFGRDRQSNLGLSEDCLRAASSLDPGTPGGYETTSTGTSGVLDVKVVISGDPEMMRDYDPIRAKHIGGKVDIYVKGTNERTITETFAFQFESALNVRFDVIDATNLVFRARDSRLTPSNPIQEMLFNPGQNLGLRNHSNLPTTSYDLTGVAILDYQTIRLSTLIPQPETMLDDFIEGDYRFRSNSKFTASVQPILRVTSVIGTLSGVIDPTAGFTLYKIQDPLLEGESTIAKDYVVINQINNVPAGISIPVNDEQHVLIGQFQEPLGSVGINVFTIKVYSLDRTILYNGPDAVNPDYLIVAGSQTETAKIVRSTDSSILSGGTVSVDYEHDENFDMTYVVNDVLQQLQARVQKRRHTTADVLVKQAVENPMALEMTIQLLPNSVQSTTDQAVRTNVSVLLDGKKTGQSVHQTDIVSKVETATGVDYIVQPFTRMTLRDGATRIREAVLSDYDFLPSLSRSNNAVYILTQNLPYATMDGGGPATVHHGVYKDELLMQESPDLVSVGMSVNLSYIIGNQGAVIPGYSDEATLRPIGVTDAGVEAERLRRTANHVVVSLDFGVVPADTPSAHSFAATYVISGDTGSKDINTTGIEYLTPGDLVITYKAAKAAS
jgi:hypothetical protein